MASKDLILKIAERYLRAYPVPEDISLVQGLFKLSYSRSNPYINAKTTEEVFVPLKHIEMNQKLSPRTALSNFALTFDEKANVMKQTNSFDGIKTEEIHEKVIQDDVFGRARLNKEGNRWVYIAKKKANKPKSYFLGGSGQERFVQDFGETYEGVNNVGLFIWDLEQKKVSEVEVSFEGDTQYILANPIFANDEGTKIICHGYKRT